MYNNEFHEAVLEDMAEALDYTNPDNEESALDDCRVSLSEWINAKLTYTADILAIWDTGTHGNVDLSQHDDIMEALAESAYWQLEEDYSPLAYDAVDVYIEKHITDVDYTDRDEALDAIYESRV